MFHKRSGQAEILRSSQKDKFITNRLGSSIKNIIQTYLGTKFITKFDSEIDSVAKFFYYILTTGLGNQTLGEEYVNIIQTQSNRLIVPTSASRIAFVFLHSFGLYLTERITHKIIRLFENAKLAKKPKIDFISRNYTDVISVILDCHLALFYIGGLYLELSKRLTGITYVPLRQWLLRQNSYSYKILGVLTAFRIVLSVYQRLKTNRMHDVIQTHNAAAKPKSTNVCIEKCSFCLELREQTTCTPCGHLFCWNCIVEWVTQNSYCPVCRHKVEPPQLVYVRNY